MKVQICCSMLGCVLSIGSAQWVQTTGPAGSPVPCVVRSGPHLYAGSGGGGVFHSSNSGASWTAIGLLNKYITSLVVLGDTIFAGTSSDGVFRSTSNGESWTEVNSDLTNRSINCLSQVGTSLFAGTEGGGVFLSTNGGASWTAFNTGLTKPYVRCLAVDDSTIFAGTRWGGTTGAGVFRSHCNDAQWIEVSDSMGQGVSAITIMDFDVFAGRSDTPSAGR